MGQFKTSRFVIKLEFLRETDVETMMDTQVSEIVEACSATQMTLKIQGKDGLLKKQMVLQQLFLQVNFFLIPTMYHTQNSIQGGLKTYV